MRSAILEDQLGAEFTGLFCSPSAALLVSKTIWSRFSEKVERSGVALAEPGPACPFGGCRYSSDLNLPFKQARHSPLIH